jgi:hypothetical protein
MAIDEPPKVNLEDPDRRFPILKWLVKGKLPPTRQKHDASPAEQRLLSSSMASFTSVGQLTYSCGASSGIKAASYLSGTALGVPLNNGEILT